VSPVIQVEFLFLQGNGARVLTKAIQADVCLCHPGVGCTRQKEKIWHPANFSFLTPL